MEKVKFGTEKFELTVNGVDPFTEGMLTLSFIPAGKTLKEVEDLLMNPQNTKRIEVLNEQDDRTGISWICRPKDLKDY